MLSAVVSKDLSLGEMKEEASRYRGLQAIKRAFCRCTNTSWQEATLRYPRHTDKERLSQFLGLNFSKSLPGAFQSYCEAAMLQDINPYSHNEAAVYTVKHSCFTVSHTTITDSGVPYRGYNLFIAQLPEVHTVNII